MLSETTKKLYIGQTNNLIKRIERHNNGKNFSTKNRGPWKVVFSKEFDSRNEAMKFEKYLKSLKNQQYIFENYINNSVGKATA